jgi:hypothetical protein
LDCVEPSSVTPGKSPKVGVPTKVNPPALPETVTCVVSVAALATAGTASAAAAAPVKRRERNFMRVTTSASCAREAGEPGDGSSGRGGGEDNIDLVLVAGPVRRPHRLGGAQVEAGELRVASRRMSSGIEEIGAELEVGRGLRLCGRATEAHRRRKKKGIWASTATGMELGEEERWRSKGIGRWWWVHHDACRQEELGGRERAIPRVIWSVCQSQLLDPHVITFHIFFNKISS